MVDRWYPLTISQTLIAGGFTIVLTTDKPCHLWLYWTDSVPWVHRTSTIERGLAVPWDAYWCFVAWHMIPQDEPGDTTTHTFTWLGWMNCQTKYFRFHGTIGLVNSPSDSPIFHKHYLWTAPIISILRPNGVAPWGDFCEGGGIRAFPGGAHWTCVDDVIPDDDASLLYLWTGPPNSGGECFAVTDPDGPGGTITNVRITGRFRGFDASGIQGSLGIAFGDGINYHSPRFNLATGWHDHSHDWPLNPHTHAAWTWQEIIDLAPGYCLAGTSPMVSPAITQLYVEVSS